MDKSQRQRLTQQRGGGKRERTLYDEWLLEEKNDAATTPATTTTPSTTPTGQERQNRVSMDSRMTYQPVRSRHGSIASTLPPPPPPPLRSGTTAAAFAGHDYRSGSTIRAVTPEDARSARASNAGDDEPDATVSERGTDSFERQFLPHVAFSSAAAAATRATIATPIRSNSGGGHALRGSSDRPTSPGNSSSLTSPTSNGAVAAAVTAESVSSAYSPASSPLPSPSYTAAMLASGTSGSNGDFRSQHGHQNILAGPGPGRPRTRTLDNRSTSDDGFGTLPLPGRRRVGSHRSTSSADYQGKEYLSSVPAATSPQPPPSISSLGSPGLVPTDPSSAERRSESPVPSPSTNVEAATSALPPAYARRIQHLMKTLQGRMSGNLIFRGQSSGTWVPSYCSIHEHTARLVYEPKGSNGAHGVLVSDLRGCIVSLASDGDVPFIKIRPPYSASAVEIKLLNQADFDSWYAALLCWNSSTAAARSATKADSDMPAALDALQLDPPQPSASLPTRTGTDSSRSGRRKSVGSTLKEAPVIKVGKMVFWDTVVGYTGSINPSLPGSALSSPVLPTAPRIQTQASKRWRRISGQLRENGELKLYADVDNTLLSVVQLSQLSRCAIQRLDPSVLDDEFCIAIYPQYTSGPNSTSTTLRPIFLSLETRVLYEVWFVLLRAFTIPQLYGPRLPDLEGDHGSGEPHDLESMLATSTTDMFRMERSLHIKIVEAKILPSALPPVHPSQTESSSGRGSGRHAVEPYRAPNNGFHVEIVLDDETRAKTNVKAEGFNPLWAESFAFSDLPAVLSSASVVVKRRMMPDRAQTRTEQDNRWGQDAHRFGDDNAQGGYAPRTNDTTCGKVEVYLEELEAAGDVEKWWPVSNMYNQRIGEILIKARAEEGVILMARAYEPLGDLLHHFSNGLTSQIAAMIPSELKRLSDCLLNIYQVSGKVSDWLMALVEEEIDGANKESSTARMRYDQRSGPNDIAGGDYGQSTTNRRAERDVLVRDLNKTAALEANLLFRGNTLLTKSLDTHMRRVGKEYLEQVLGEALRDINERNPDCEVDPNKVEHAYEIERNWKRLMGFTQRVWNAISSSRHRIPIELKVIFRHIRACAEDRYGEFLRTVSYSSVSGFLFLRFYCPAVLNPTLFSLVKDEIKPRARRTFTLIAKSLQTLANMASFGNKEPWMEHMNTFLTLHRETFKSFIDDICYVPSATPPSMSNATFLGSGRPVQLGLPPGVVSTETHHSYITPITIMQRLPPSSREGFPSLPYLIDQARAFADLIQLWLESSVEPDSEGQSRQSVVDAFKKPDGNLLAFHTICTNLHERTQECLNRAERAERPSSSSSFRWEELIGQLQDKPYETLEERPTQSFEEFRQQVAGESGFLSLASMQPDSRTSEQSGPPLRHSSSKGVSGAPPLSASSPEDPPASRRNSRRASTTATKSGSRHSMHNPSKPATLEPVTRDPTSASSSKQSFSSDADADRASSTAPSSPFREQFQGVQEAQKRRHKDREKERQRVKALVPALRKRRDRDKDQPEQQGWLG